MPSSISSSETEVLAKPLSASSTRSIALLLAIVSVFLIGIEVGTRRFIVRMSRVESREDAEYREAVAMRPAGGRGAVLFAGNSLMGVGLDFDRVRAGLASTWDARRLYVDSTAYFDLYYGLRRLYAEGARFNAVVVFLPPQYLIANAVRGDYFAYRLMRLSDVFSVARNIGFERTATANLAFANISAFYGLRAEFRKVLLGRLMPDMPALMSLATRKPGAPVLPDEVTYRRALPRLQGYRELAGRQHLRIFLVLPPQPAPTGMAAVQRAGAAAGVTVLRVPQETTTPADFLDGFHLNPEGKQKFTAALLPELRRVLDSPAHAVGVR
jgi:hypothetical protein